jgi:hypothetical protein
VATQNKTGEGGYGVSDGVGARRFEFLAARRRLGEADGSNSRGPADLYVGHGVADQDRLVSGPVEEVERTLNR